MISRSELEVLGGVSNRWNGIWNGTMEWKMEWNGKHTQLQLTRVTGAAHECLYYSKNYQNVDDRILFGSIK